MLETGHMRAWGKPDVFLYMVFHPLQGCEFGATAMRADLGGRHD